MMSDHDASYPPSDNPEAIPALIHRLTEAEAALQAALSDQVDVVIDPTDASPYMLRRAQDALRRSEARYSQLMARLAAFVFELEPDGTIRFINDAVTHVTGYDPEEVLLQNWRQVFFPGDLGAQADQLETYWLSGDVTNYELTMRAKDGALLILELNSANQYSESGVLEYVVGLGIDITQRRQAENALLAHQASLETQVAHRTAQLQAILDNMTEALVIADPLTNTLYHNPAALALHGYDAGEDTRSLDGLMTLFQVMDLDGHSLPDEMWPMVRALRGETFSNCELQVRYLPADKSFIGSFNGTPVYDADGRLLHALITIRDITAQKQAEAVLIESEARYRAIGETIPFGVWVTDAAGRATYLSQSFLDLVGMTLEDCQQYGWANHLVPETKEKTLAAWQLCVENEADWTYEHHFVGQDGQIYTILGRGVPLRNAAGQVTSWVGVNLDITERKRIEQAEHDQRVLAEALNQIALALSSTLNLPDVLDMILTSVAEVVPYETVDLMLIEPDGQIRVAGSRGYERDRLEESLQGLRFSYHDYPLLRQMVETGEPVVVPDLASCAEWIPTSGTEWRRSFVGMPIMLHREIIGFLNVTSLQPDFFIPPVVDRLQALANQAALAVQNARLYEQVQIAAATHERERLARDLHDVVSQTLFSASLVAEALPRQWERDPSKALSQLADLLQLTRIAQAEMRTLLLELRPQALIDAEMKVLLPQLIDSMRSRRRIDLSLQVDDQVALEPEVKISLYRIAQEALNNMVKHSGATEASVVYHAEPSKVQLVITDNGRGFDLHEIPSTSLGLGIMRERAAAAGAALTVSSHPAQGTRIIVVWPATSA